MMNKLFAGVMLAGCLTAAHAQHALWQRDLRSPTQDFLSGLTQTIDGQILVSGSSISPQSQQPSAGAQNGGYDYHIVKLDQQGGKLWEKYFGGSNHDYLSAVAPTQEGGFLLAGTSFSPRGGDKKSESHGGSDFWIMKISEDGAEEWQGSVGTRGSEEAKSAVQSADLGYFVAGNASGTPYGLGSRDVLVARLDKSGRLLGQVLLGGSGLDEVEKAIPTRDGGCLLGIYSRSGSFSAIYLPLIDDKDQDTGSYTQNAISQPPAAHNSQPSTNHSQLSTNDPQPITTHQLSAANQNHGEGDYVVVKLDRQGKVEWQRSFGGSGDDHPRTLTLTSGGYLVGGESRSPSSGDKRENVIEGTDLWLVSLDGNGNEQWQRGYSFGNRDVLMSQNTIWDAKGDQVRGYLLGGYTQSEGVKGAGRGSGEETFWMLYIDPEGKEVWRKHVEGSSRKSRERLVDARLCRDGSYLLAGTSADELGGENWKVVKLGDKDLDNLIERQDIRIYPNPAEDYCYVELGPEALKAEGEEAEVSMFDMSGRQVQSLRTRSQVTKLDTSRLPQGTYLVTANTPSKSVNTKIVKK